MTRRRFDAKIADSRLQTVPIVHTRQVFIDNQICGRFVGAVNNDSGDGHHMNNSTLYDTMNLPGPVDAVVVQSHSAGSVSGQIVVTIQATNSYDAGDLLIFDFPGFGLVDTGEFERNTLLVNAQQPADWADTKLIWNPENFTLTATIRSSVPSRQVLCLRFVGLSNPSESKYLPYPAIACRATGRASSCKGTALEKDASTTIVDVTAKKKITGVPMVRPRSVLGRYPINHLILYSPDDDQSIRHAHRTQTAFQSY